MYESNWEKSIGNTLTRTQNAGQDGLFLQKYAKEHGHMPGPPNVRWSVIARLGQDTIDLKHKQAERDAAEDDWSGDSEDETPHYERSDDDEWDTTEWSPEDIKVAAATLVDEMMARKCAPLRREKAAGLLQRLAQRNPPAVEYLESVIEQYVIDGLRQPRYGEPPMSEKALYLVGSLSNELPDKYSRISVIFKAVAFLNYERDLAAQLIQHTWNRHVFFTNDVKTLDRRSIARRLVMVELKSSNLAHRWAEMRGRENGARVSFANTRDVLLLLDGLLQEGSSSFVGKNRWKLVQSGGLPTIVQLMTHPSVEVRAAAVSIMLSLAREVELRSSLLNVGVHGALLEILHGEADDDDDDEGSDGEDGGSDAEGIDGVDRDAAAAMAATDDPVVEPATSSFSHGAGGGAGAGGGTAAATEVIDGLPQITIQPPTLDDRLAALEVLDLLAEGGLDYDPGQHYKPVEFHRQDGNTVKGRREMIKRLAREAKEEAAKRYESDSDDSDSRLKRAPIDAEALRQREELEAKRHDAEATGGPATPSGTQDRPPPASPEKRRLTFYHERACRRRNRLAAGFDVREPFTERTLEFIAMSEAPIYVDGPDYFSTLGNEEVIQRLVNLLLAQDDPTVLGTSMVLTKLCQTNIHKLVVDTILSTANVLQSIVDLLHTPSECISTAALLLLRQMVAQEASRRLVLQQGVAAMLLVVCKATPHDSMPFTLALLGVLAFARPDAISADSDPEPIDLNSTPLELSDALARTLLSLMTAAPREAAVCVLAIVKLGALPQVLRVLCGGFDFLGGDSGATGDGDDSDSDGGSDGGASDSGSGDGKRRHGDGGESTTSAAEDEVEDDDDKEREEDEEKWQRARERRCIAAIVLERIAQCDLAVPQLCDPRVLAFLVFILHGNRVDDAAENVYGMETTEAERRVMNVSNQAVCRTLNGLARSKVLSVEQRHRTARAILGLGAVEDVVDLISRSDPEVEPVDTVGDDTVEAALVLLATIMPKGDGDGDIDHGRVVKTIPEYLDMHKKTRNVERKARRASLTEITAQRAVEAARALGAGATGVRELKDQARRASIVAQEQIVMAQRTVEAIEASKDPHTGPNDPTRVGSKEVAAAVECIAKPVLDLLVRTRVPTMRTTALFTLARCCHCPDTAEIVHSRGALNVLVGFFPATPLLLKYFPDRVDLSDADGGSVSSARMRASGASGLARPPSPISTRSGGFGRGATTLDTIPLTAFTFMSELARTHSVKPLLCLSGVFSACLDRFIMQTSNPAQDVRVQGELSLFLARCASLSLEDWGATNAKMLRDAKVTTHKHDLDQRALGGGTVLNNLVRLLGERTHRRARYHAVLALANLADDYMLTVPPMVYAGVLPACVVVLRNPRSPHSLVRQVMRILKAVASFPMGRFSTEMVASGVVPLLTNLGSDVTLQMALPRFDGVTVADSARDIVAALGEDVVVASRTQITPSPVTTQPMSPSVATPRSHGGSIVSSRQWPPSPVDGSRGASPWATQPGPHPTASQPHSRAPPSPTPYSGRSVPASPVSGAGAGAGAGGIAGSMSSQHRFAQQRAALSASATLDPSPPRILRSSSSLSRVRMEASAAARASSAPLNRDRVAGGHVGDQAAASQRGYSQGRRTAHGPGTRGETRGSTFTNSSILKHLSQRGYTPAGVPQPTAASAVPVSSTAIQASYNYLFDPLFDQGGSNVRAQTWKQDHRAATSAKPRQLC